ncbi:hypothetical protein Tco_0687287 [Tanacetum coccineum]
MSDVLKHRTVAELAAAFRSVDAMLPQIREEVRRVTALVLFGFSPGDAEHWIFHMEEDLRRDGLRKEEGDAWSLLLTWGVFQRAFFLQFFLVAEQERLKMRVPFHPPKGRVKFSTEYMAANSGVVGTDQRNRGSQQSRVPSEGLGSSSAGTCKKNTGASSSGHADKKPDASGRVFALTQDQARQYFRTYFRKNFQEYLLFAMLSLTLSFIPELKLSPNVLMAWARFSLKELKDSLKELLERAFITECIAMGCTAVLWTWMNRVFHEFLDKFTYRVHGDFGFLFKSKEKHEAHLRTVLHDFTKEKTLYAKFQSGILGLSKGGFLGSQCLAGKGSTMDPRRVEAITKWPRPDVCDQKYGVSWISRVIPQIRRGVLTISLTLNQLLCEKYIRVKANVGWLMLDRSRDRENDSWHSRWKRRLLRNLSDHASQKYDGKSGHYQNIESETSFALRRWQFYGRREIGMTKIVLVELAYIYVAIASIKCAPFEMLYGRKCRAPICWDQVGERILEGPEMIEVTNEKVAVAREKLKEAQTRQKSYADRHRRALEFQPGEHVFLKVSPTRGVRRFGIKGKLSPRFIGLSSLLSLSLSSIRSSEDLSIFGRAGGLFLDIQDSVMRTDDVKILWRIHPERGKPLGRPRSLYGLLILIFFHDLDTYVLSAALSIIIHDLLGRYNNPTRESRVHVPNILPTHPTLQLDSDFTLSSDSLGSDLVVSFPSRTRNKIFNPRIFIRIQSKRFLSPDKFSISFIRDPPFPVIDTLLPFSSENEDKVVNPGILDAGEEKSPHLLSHRGFKAFQLISESPTMISGENTPNLDVPYLHFYPP